MIDLFSFSDDENETIQKCQNIYDIVKNEIFKSDKDTFVDMVFDCVNSIIYAINNDILDFENLDQSELFKNLIENFYKVCFEENDKGETVEVPVEIKDFRSLACMIPILSLSLYYVLPEYPFFPILFNHNFNEFIDRCNLLGIEIPKIPLQKDKEERCLFYNEICKNIREFMDVNELTKEEVCACIYGYAANFLKQNRKEEELTLPSPTRIWLTGASKGDYKMILTNSSGDIKDIWACNESTKRGDIVIVYALAPYSQIHSIWRAAEDGNVNPFDYYCNRVTVTDRIIIPPVTFQDLKNDSYTVNMPIVKKNLQGINGVELTIQDYNELLRIIKSKGGNIENLPKLESPNLQIREDVKLEKDVEEKLLIPLLTKLGYSNVDGKDWKRQVVVKLGRKEKYIPDFVFFPKSESHYQVEAPFLIEAKYDMKNNNERKSAFSQACSYAHPLASKLFGICDKNFIRIYKSKTGFFTENDIIFDEYWNNIQKPEKFNELKKIIGRDVVSALK
jgi:hypothetical protein